MIALMARHLAQPGNTLPGLPMTVLVIAGVGTILASEARKRSLKCGMQAVRPEAAGRFAEPFPPSGEASSGLPSAGDYSRSILRSPCVGVHHSTTSIVAFSLRCVCTTSAMSA